MVARRRSGTPAPRLEPRSNLQTLSQTIARSGIVRLAHLAKLGFLAVVRLPTYGVRVVVLKGGEDVLLVRHTYEPGWHLPGGGVRRGETAEVAARREVLEEAGIVARGEAVTLGQAHRRVFGRTDHVTGVLIRDWRQKGFKPGLEIAACRFFPLNDLPADFGPQSRYWIDRL